MEQLTDVKSLSHTDKKIPSIIENLKNVDTDASYYLLLMAGKYKSGKKSFMSRVQKQVGEFEEFDLAEYVDYNEEKSFERIDALFRYIGETEKNVMLRNGDVLSGEYTGFSYSSQKYATPQGKYLLRKIESSERFIVLDIEDSANVDKTMERYAQLAVRFDEADSLFGKILWRLKQIRIQGHTFSAKRTTAA